MRYNASRQTHRQPDYRPIGRRQVLQKQEPRHGRIAGMRRSGKRYPSRHRSGDGLDALTQDPAYPFAPFEIGTP
jgi:hypothetical protein